MNEACFEIVLDVLAREIDMLRYQVKVAGDECEKLRTREDVLMTENAKLHDQVAVFKAENAKPRARTHAMIEEGRENHE